MSAEKNFLYPKDVNTFALDWGRLALTVAPEVNGEFRPGEMRHLTSDTTRVRDAGYEPHVDLAEGIRRYIDWIKAQSDVRDYFSEAAKILRSKGIVHRVKVMDA